MAEHDITFNLETSVNEILPLPSTPEEELQHVIIATSPRAPGRAHVLTRRRQYNVIRVKQRPELLRNEALINYLTEKNLRHKNTLHAETQYIGGEDGSAIAAEAQTNDEAIAVISLLSPCVYSFRCTAEIANFAQETGVPHYVIYRYRWPDSEESLAEFTRRRIPVFQAIGDRLFLRNREMFFSPHSSGHQTVSSDSFVRYLASQNQDDSDDTNASVSHGDSDDVDGESDGQMSDYESDLEQFLDQFNIGLYQMYGYGDGENDDTDSEIDGDSDDNDSESDDGDNESDGGMSDYEPDFERILDQFDIGLYKRYESD